MTTTLTVKPGIDLPVWRPLAPPLAIDAAGTCLAWDHRGDYSRIPNIYCLRSAIALDIYSPLRDDWMPLASPALSAFAAGSAMVFHPSQGPRGTLAAGGSTTTVVLATALPAAVGVNQLADCGDGTGFLIRIANKVSGHINHRLIVGNTAGTTPTITVASPLDFTPAANDLYEIHSGRVYLLGSGLLAAGSWKYYDAATNSYSANLATANLPATVAIDSNGLPLSEDHVPSDRMTGTGFLSGTASYDPNGVGLNGALSTAKNCIQGTAATATTITGSGMPADLVANEYANFQVRIVDDATAPAAVGQRALITSHTAGATGVFTVASWPGGTPSAVAKFVVENNDDLILLRSSATATVYTYSISANAWSITTFAASGSAVGAGVVFDQCYGIVRDPSHNRRHSHLFCLRGGASAAIDLLDISAGPNGTWSNAIVYGNQAQTFTTGTSGAYDGVSLGGKFWHICVNGTQRMVRFNMQAQVMEAGTYVRYPPSVAVVGQKLAFNFLLDGPTRIGMLINRLQSLTVMLSNLIQL